MKQKIAMELSLFLSETEDIRKTLNELAIDDVDCAQGVLDSIILLNNTFNDSFIKKYLSEKTEIHVFDSDHVYH